MKSGAAALIPIVAIVVVLCMFGASIIDVFPNNDSTDKSTNYNTLSSTETSAGSIESFVVILDGNTGAELDGDGTYKVGTNVTVTATCDDDTTFVAWLDADGNVVSEDVTYTFRTTSTKTVKLFASCITSIDWENGISQLYSESGWTSAVWTVYEYDGDDLTKIGTSNNGRFAFPETGTYRVVISAVDSDGKEIEMTSEIAVRETVFEYEWNYGRYTFTVEAEIPYADYSNAVKSMVTRGLLSNMSNALTFVTPEETCVSEIAEQISEQLDKYGITDTDDVANIVLDLVQMSITYTEDDDQYGQDEYFAFPIETLYSQKGDCEDTTYLFASIMKSMGYDTVVCFVQYGGPVSGGHAFVLIEMDSGNGTAYSLKQGYKSVNGSFYYCETAVDEGYDMCDVGCAMSEYGYIAESYCFMTDDGKSVPTDYSLSVSQQSLR